MRKAEESFNKLLEKAVGFRKALFGTGGYWNFRYFEKHLSLSEEEKEKYLDFYRSISDDEELEDIYEEDIEYELRECYYDDNDNIVAWSSGITPIWCENRKDLKNLLKKARKASYRNTVIIENDKAIDSGRKMKRNWKK